jgi:hypothetical protein
MIDPKYYGLIELTLFGAIVLGFAIWQLWTVRDAGKPKDPPKDALPKDSGHPEG